jgi:5-methyltetrahydropteroyltriglutamate--homocysteine methyltransferase
VALRVRLIARYVAADRLVPAPDCGMKYMPLTIALGRLKAMYYAPARVRKELS